MYGNLKQQNNKAFTLVELAIVLVIIGLIMGMAIKGKALIDIARMKREVVKISKFETAFHIWYARSGSFPPDSGVDPTGRQIGFKPFIDAGLITDTDTKCLYSSSPYSDFGGWIPYYLDIDRASPTKPWYTNAKITGMPFVGVLSYGTRADLICSIETTLDDGSLDTGLMRNYISTPTQVSLTPAVLADCFEAKGEAYVGYRIWN